MLLALYYRYENTPFKFVLNFYLFYYAYEILAPRFRFFFFEFIVFFYFLCGIKIDFFFLMKVQ